MAPPDSLSQDDFNAAIAAWFANPKTTPEGDISGWNTSEATDMSSVFKNGYLDRDTHSI
tara:strand:+ start:189 stop:365 length:177 start_codon:yes stop_codon:yes gene_type:complete